MRYVETAKVILDIHPLSRRDVNLGGGLDALPTMVFMAKPLDTGNSTPPTWWGLHLRKVKSISWSDDDAQDVCTQAMKWLKAAGLRPHSDLLRVMGNLKDLVTGKKKPVIYGNGDKDLLQAHFIHGCHINVYRDPAALTIAAPSGGYEGTAWILGARRTFFLYHRGVCLYNYLNEEEALAAISDYLPRLFPEVIQRETLVPELVKRHLRQRGK